MKARAVEMRVLGGKEEGVFDWDGSRLGGRVCSLSP